MWVVSFCISRYTYVIVESSLLTNLDVGRSQGQLFKSNIERFVLFRIEHIICI